MKKDFLNRITEWVLQSEAWKKFFSKDQEDKLLGKMRSLYPARYHEKEQEYIREKIRLVILVLLMGVGVFLILTVKEIKPRFEPLTTVSREGLEGQDQSLILELESEKLRKKVQVPVSKMQYTKSQLKRLYEEAIPILEEAVLGNNRSLQEVRSDLTLVTELEGYPFDITWESENYSVVAADGTVHNLELEENTDPIRLDASFSCQDYRCEYTFFVQVYPPDMTKEEGFLKSIEKELQIRNQQNPYSESIPLPKQLHGAELIWKRPFSYTGIGFLVGSIILSAVLVKAKDQDLEKELSKRKGELERDYADFVSKFAVYIEAGLTMRSTWKRIIQDGEKRPGRISPYIQEEMKISLREMEGGYSEAQAYERFAERIGVASYRKFMVVLIQNLQKGSASMSTFLREESREAFEQRKNKAKELGEIAGTKMLFPMMLMLSVVLIMIMIPAFFSFG